MTPGARLATTIGTALLVVVGVELYARRAVEAPTTGEITRAANVTIAPSEPQEMPPWPVSEPALLLLGNSHTYALPALAQGGHLRPDPGATLIDELAREIERRHPDARRARYYRMSEPNLLPFEMLTQISWLLHAERVPRVLVLGLTWRNIARDVQLRHAIRSPYGDARFGAWLRDSIAGLEGLTAGERALLDAGIAAELRRAETDAKEAAKDHAKSAADRLDLALTKRLGGSFRLLGASAELRAHVYRTIAYLIEDLFVTVDGTKYTYDVIEPELTFNRACLRALFRLLRARGVGLVVYFAPERQDLPPLMNPARQVEVMSAVRADAEALGAVVLDAKTIVPDGLWGWEHNLPDRSHFTEPGHQLLAKFIVDGADARGAWAPLEGGGP